jgi:hypothetical protein
MQAIEQKILSRIYGRGRGWVFSKTDFVAEFSETNIHKALSSLTKAGTIRRVFLGVYDYPRQSDLLGQLSPDIDQIAQALARKFNWRIQPAGDTALNLLGLSTQVPGKWLYLSDGPSRRYAIGEQELAFRKTALKDTGFALRESGLLVPAIKALGKEHIDAAVIEKLRQWLEQKLPTLPNLRTRLLRDTRMVTGWIFEIIKQICQEHEGRA